MIAFALILSTFAPSPSTVRSKFSLGRPHLQRASLEPPTPGPPSPPTKHTEPSPCEQTKAIIHSDALFQNDGNKQNVTDIALPATALQCSKTRRQPSEL